MNPRLFWRLVVELKTCRSVVAGRSACESCASCWRRGDRTAHHRDEHGRLRFWVCRTGRGEVVEHADEVEREHGHDSGEPHPGLASAELRSAAQQSGRDVSLDQGRLVQRDLAHVGAGVSEDVAEQTGDDGPPGSAVQCDGGFDNSRKDRLRAGRLVGQFMQGVALCVEQGDQNPVEDLAQESLFGSEVVVDGSRVRPAGLLDDRPRGGGVESVLGETAPRSPAVAHGCRLTSLDQKLYFLGLSLFGAASLAAAYSQTSGQLIAARVVMAVGASLLMPATLSIVQQIFAPAERQKAVSIWAGAASIGVPIGPIVGGFLLEHYWWGSVFLINVPIVIIAIAAGAFLIPVSVRAALRAAAVDGFLAGAQTSLWIASAITILGALLSAWLLPGKAPTPA